MDAGERRILFETGAEKSRLFGPTPGKLMTSHAAAGIDAASITDIICAHGHCDPVWGTSLDASVSFPAPRSGFQRRVSTLGPMGRSCRPPIPRGRPPLPKARAAA